MLRKDAIQSIVTEHGHSGYLQIQNALLEGRTLPNGQQMKPVSPGEFSIQALWEGLVGPMDETLGYAQRQRGYVEVLTEAVTSTAFPSATGQLISRAVIEGYDQPGFIGDQLVRTVPSRLRGERMVGFTTLQGALDVEEHAEYKDSSFGEKYVTTTEQKRGRILSVTEEAVFYDQTGEMIRRAEMLGEMMREDKERRIVRGVIDAESAVRVYRPSGTAEQLYVAGNNNLLSTATPLVDWTDIQEALAYHAANVRDDRQQTGEGIGQQPISWMPKILLTARKIAGNAARVVSATEVRNNDILTPNTTQTLVPGLIALSSPYVDAAEGADQFDDADDWFLGDFRKQFIYKEIWPIQTFRSTDMQFSRDILVRFKVREYGDVNCTDERHVIKINAV